MTHEIAYAREMKTCGRSRKVVILVQEQECKHCCRTTCALKDQMMNILKGHTEDQASQDIRAKDVIQAENLVWYTWAERKAWQEKTTAGIPTYGNCTDCYWGGPVGMVCMHCEGKDERKPTYQVLQVGDKLMDSRWVARFFKKGHEVAKADRKHRWLRTSSVRLPLVGKFADMVEKVRS